MKSIAILTFHAAHNYGSVLQAVATQNIIDRLSGLSSVIVNYRFPEQKKVYALYQHNGIKSELKNLVQLPLHKKRLKKASRFEDFICHYMRLTKEAEEPEQVYSQLEKYDALICGSDQIWNKHANELENVDWRYMLPYLGDKYQGKLISYGSSIANMNDGELDYIKPYLQRFDAISAREHSGADRLSKLFKKKVPMVLDPTFLMTADDWTKKLNVEYGNQNDYILYYTLHGYGDFKNIQNILISIAQKAGKPIKIIAPFYVRQKDSYYLQFETDFGPIEFLESLVQAESIITDSFHGMALALNFKKKVLPIITDGKAESRKIELLAALGIEEIGGPLESLERRFTNGKNMEYSDKLEELRKKSLLYLESSLH